MIEVRLRRQLPGCMYWPLAVMTLGLFVVLQSAGERHFALRMDEGGIETRGKKRIAWNEFTSIERVQGTMKGAVLSDEYILKSAKGKVSLPLWRTGNAQEVRDYAFRHLPPNLLRRGQ